MIDQTFHCLSILSNDNGINEVHVIIGRQLQSVGDHVSRYNTADIR